MGVPRDGRCGRGRALGRSSREVGGISAYCDTIFAVVDASTIRKDVDIGAFGAELAVTLLGLEMLRCVWLCRLTLAKYLQTFSADWPRSWLKGQALPAWQAPWRKNLQGT